MFQTSVSTTFVSVFVFFDSFTHIDFVSHLLGFFHTRGFPTLYYFSLSSFLMLIGGDSSFASLVCVTSVACVFDAWVAFTNSPELGAPAGAPHTKYL